MRHAAPSPMAAPVQHLYHPPPAGAFLRPINESAVSPSDNPLDHYLLLPPFSPPAPSFAAHHRNPPPTDLEIARRLRSTAPMEQEAALLLLHDATRDSEDLRSTLCTPLLLSALLPHLRSAPLRPHAFASIANFSLDSRNRLPVLRSRAVPALVAALGVADPEVRSHAAAAIHALSLERSCVAPVGMLGAVPPLAELAVCTGEDLGTRRDAAMALHRLCKSCEGNARRLAGSGLVGALLGVMGEGDDLVEKAVAAVVGDVAGCWEGRGVLVEAGAVEVAVAVMGRGGRKWVELCLRVLARLSRAGWRFWAVANAVGAEAALEALWSREAEEGMAKAAEVARRLLVLGERGRD